MNGYDVNEQTLSGVVDYYANRVETENLFVKGIEITGMVVGPTGATGAQGIQGNQGIQGIQGAKGDKGDNGSDADASAVQAQVVVLDALVAGLGVTTVALGTTVAGLSASLTTVQGEVGVLGGKVSTLENQTKFISSTTKTSVSSDLVINNGVQNKIELKTDGTIDCLTTNSTTVNASVLNATDELNCPEIKTTNIVPYTTPFGVINIATGGVLETINIGNPTSIVNIDGNVFFNRSLGTDTFNLGGFLNQFI